MDKKSDDQGAASESDTRLMDSADPQDQQIAELKDLTRSLLNAVQAMHTQSARNAVFQEAIADVKFATKAMLVAPSIAVSTPNDSRIEQRCKSSPCDCVSDGCCCFDIMISQVRAAKPQIEAPDAGDVPGLINALEVQIYFTVDRIGYLWPGLATTMDLRADGAPGGPGPWVVIERAVNRICIPKGTTVVKRLEVECREHDEGVERPLAFKDELGEASGSITLDCCMSEIFPQLPIDVYLNHGGEGRGMIQVAYYAKRVCC